MKPYLRILFGLLLIFYGYHAIKREFGGVTIGVLSEFDSLPFALVITLTIIIFVVDTSYFKIDRKIHQYFFSFIGLIICLIVFFKIIERKSIDNSKTILKVVNKAGANNVWQFDFKDDSHFSLAEYGLFGHTVFYGKYQKQDDTLKITESNYSGNANQLPTIGVIRADTVFWNKFDTMLVDHE